MHTSREIHLASRPHGEPTPENFRLVEAQVPAPGADEVLVRNSYISVDPYMRGRMKDVKSYTPPFGLDEVMTGGALGEVIETASPALAVGDMVLHNRGWREYAVASAAEFRRVDPAAVPTITDYLGVAGLTGFTAWVGLFDIAGMRPGDTVFISAAAGAVGSIAGQMARLRGAERVIGSAGSAAKIDYATNDLGFNAAFDYHDGPALDRLRELAPEGIDVYFDNVGGEQLEAAMYAMRDHGRLALCGAISQYNATEPPPGPRDMFQVVSKRLKLQGFIIGDHADRMQAFLEEVGAWLRAGEIRSDETVVGGIENAPEAFLGVMRGDNTGKMLVRV